MSWCAFAVGLFKHISVAATEGRARSMHFEVAAARHLKTNRLLPGCSPYKMECNRKKREETVGGGALEATPSTAVQSI